MFFATLVQVAVPLLLIAIIARGRAPNRWMWTLNAVAFGMVIAYMWASARWDLSSMYLRAALPILFVAAAIFGWRRMGTSKQKPSRWGVIVESAVSLALIVAMSGFNWFSFRAHVTPEGAVDLAPPLRDGRAVILNGGSSPFTNGHFRLKGQGFALDMLGLTRLGQSAEWLGDREDLATYPIYGRIVYSPCEGRVVAARDGLADLIPPITDTENLAGNHVLVECQDVEVLLAHLQNGSVSVAVGDSVTLDSRLGRVGNTGNTSEPHLHIHAERGGEPGIILDGKSVPIRIGGRYLVRGDILDAEAVEG